MVQKSLQNAFPLSWCRASDWCSFRYVLSLHDFQQDIFLLHQLTPFAGIGQAVAAAFAAEGCTRIAICDTSLEGLNETAKQLNATKIAEFVEIEIVKVDVSNSSAVHSMIDQIVARWGRVDYVVNSAGIQGPSLRSTDLDPADFDIINDINYRGLWLCSRAQLSQMLKQEISPSHDGRPGARGSIVHIASQLGLVARTVAREYRLSRIMTID